MSSFARLFAGCATFALVALPADAQEFRGLTVGISMNVPTGDFEEIVSHGFGLAVRTPIGDSEKRFSGRGGLFFDYMKGSEAYANIQFMGVEVDLVHRSSEYVYQFVGIGQSSTKYALKPSANGTTLLRQYSDFGVNGGLGVKFKRGDYSYYVEFTARTFFTSATNSSWFPIRFGMSF